VAVAVPLLTLTVWLLPPSVSVTWPSATGLPLASVTKALTTSFCPKPGKLVLTLVIVTVVDSGLTVSVALPVPLLKLALASSTKVPTRVKLPGAKPPGSVSVVLAEPLLLALNRSLGYLAEGVRRRAAPAAIPGLGPREMGPRCESCTAV
jgi:hypothetical protein